MTDVVRQANGELINPTFDSIDDSDFVFFNGALYFAGNDGTRGNELWRITLTARTSSSTTLSSSLNPSTIGDQVTFTATVTGASPTGTIAFFDSGTPLGTVTLVSGVASLDLITLGVGSHTITASYSGDADDAPGILEPPCTGGRSAPTAPTTTTLISAPNPSDFGEAVTFTATVAGGSPTGTVTFFDGGTPRDIVPLAGNTAISVTSSLSGGSRTITARYNGDADDSASNVERRHAGRQSVRDNDHAELGA